MSAARAFAGSWSTFSVRSGPAACSSGGRSTFTWLREEISAQQVRGVRTLHVGGCVDHDSAAAPDAQGHGRDNDQSLPGPQTPSSPLSSTTAAGYLSHNWFQLDYTSRSDRAMSGNHPDSRS